MIGNKLRTASTAAAPSMEATGGTKTISGGYVYHVFTSSGTFTATSIPSGTGDIEFIAVAGGGGGSYDVSGGGGAGGLAYNTITVGYNAKRRR